MQWSSCTVPFILDLFKCHLNFLDRFSKNTQISSYTKIRSLGAELFSIFFFKVFGGLLCKTNLKLNVLRVMKQIL